MSNRVTYFVLGLCAALAVGAAVYAYHDSQRSGVEISVGRDGVSIQER